MSHSYREVPSKWECHVRSKTDSPHVAPDAFRSTERLKEPQNVEMHTFQVVDETQLNAEVEVRALWRASRVSVVATPDGAGVPMSVPSNYVRWVQWVEAPNHPNPQRCFRVGSERG